MNPANGIITKAANFWLLIMRSPALFLLGFLRSSVFQRFAFPNAYLRCSATRRLSFPPVHSQRNQRQQRYQRNDPQRNHAVNAPDFQNVFFNVRQIERKSESRDRCRSQQSPRFAMPDRQKRIPAIPMSATGTPPIDANLLLFTVPQSHFSLMLHGDASVR